MNFIEILKMLKEAGATDDQLHKVAYALIPRSDKPANGSKRLGAIGMSGTSLAFQNREHP